MRARFERIDALKDAFPVIPSLRALKVGTVILRVFDQPGVSDQRATSSRRVGSGASFIDSRTTATGSVGRMFQPGRQSRKSPPTATNSSIKSSVLLSIAKRPHMISIILGIADIR